VRKEPPQLGKFTLFMQYRECLLVNWETSHFSCKINREGHLVALPVCPGNAILL
jgi:hypothetical protein